jgi:hypothetical protein
MRFKDEVTRAVKVRMWFPEVPVMLRLSKVAVPSLEVTTDVVPLRVPGPVAFVAVIV